MGYCRSGVQREGKPAGGGISLLQRVKSGLMDRHFAG
jgi:hypothetical protein